MTAPSTSIGDAPATAVPAFERLYRECRDDVFAYVMGLLRDVHAAEDATAIAFERAYRKRRRFDPDRGSGRAWVFGIARNAALDELRKRKRTANLYAEPADAEEDDTFLVVEEEEGDNVSGLLDSGPSGGKEGEEEV